MTPAPDSAPTRLRQRRIVSVILGIEVALAAILAVILVALIVEYRGQEARTSAAAFDSASAEALAAADALSQTLGDAMATVQAIADELESGALSYDDDAIESRFRQHLDAYPRVLSTVVAFAPFAFAPDQPLHLVEASRDADGTITTSAGLPPFDYTLPPDSAPDSLQTQLYLTPLESGPTWSEPRVYLASGQVLIDYGLPLFRVDPATGQREVAGVLSQTYSLEDLRELVANLPLGQTGFGAVFSQSGTWLAHPIPEFTANRTIYDDARTETDQALVDATARALAGETVDVDRVSPETGEPVWNFFSPIDSTDWVLVVELSQAEFRPEEQSILEDLTWIVLVAGALLFVILAMVFRADRGEPHRLWAMSIAFSVIALLAIGIIIALSRYYVQDRGVAISNQAALNSYLENLDDEFAARGLTPPVKIPTGVLLQSARFPDNTSVTVNGTIWQRVPQFDDTEIAEGFVLPQLIDEPMMFEEILREERPNETLVVWSVVAALQQAFDPAEYPFDRHDINVRLVPAELQSNAVLVPDLTAYDVTAPGFLPGLDSELRIRDWMLLDTAFRYQRQRYGTTFSLPGRPTVEVPELNFTIGTQRRFLGPFIAFLLPAVVAALMIFAFLLSDRKPDEPEEIVTALTYTAALFFVIAVMHTALRENAAAVGLTYLEYFYLMLYVMTVFVAVNTFFVVNRSNYRLIRYGRNLIAKLLYWPVVLTVMLVATLTIFAFG